MKLRERRPPELRRPDRTDAILDATYELLAEMGYHRLTVDAVAARARASKATIYRRWETKQELVISAFQRQGAAQLPTSADTGSLRGDLRALLDRLRAVTTPNDARAFVSLLTASEQEPGIADVMRGQLVAGWRGECERIVRRARDRGELGARKATVDHDTVFDLIVGQVVVRTVIRGERLDDRFVDHVVDKVLVPVLGSRTA